MTALAVLLALACSGESAAPAPVVSPVTVAPAAAPALERARDDAERLDSRAPVPLLPMMAQHQKEQMRDHLLAVQEILAAASRDDFEAVERAAGRIGYSESMAAQCEHMGAAAPGFAERALEFHRTADTIADAARARDRTAVLAATSITLSTCVTCHATYRAQVVPELPPAPR